MEGYEKFFNKMVDYRIETRFYENGESFEVEELYQAFKARLIAELAVSAPDLRTLGLIVEKDSD